MFDNIALSFSVHRFGPCHAKRGLPKDLCYFHSKRRHQDKGYKTQSVKMTEFSCIVGVIPAQPSFDMTMTKILRGPAGLNIVIPHNHRNP